MTNRKKIIRSFTIYPDVWRSFQAVAADRGQSASQLMSDLMVDLIEDTEAARKRNAKRKREIV